MEARGDTDGSTASGGEGAQGGGGASSYSDDPETELRQIMRSSDFQKFCSLCQMQGQGDVFAICRQHVVQCMVHHTLCSACCVRHLQGIHAPPVGAHDHSLDTYMIAGPSWTTAARSGSTSWMRSGRSCSRRSGCSWWRC